MSDRNFGHLSFFLFWKLFSFAIGASGSTKMICVVDSCLLITYMTSASENHGNVQRVNCMNKSSSDILLNVFSCERKKSMHVWINMTGQMTKHFLMNSLKLKNSHMFESQRGKS